MFPLRLNSMKIEIDARSGFCIGVERAVKMAEEALMNNDELYCLGEIVHNQLETSRLKDLGLRQTSHASFDSLSGKRVLFRAHGEPPKSYSALNEKNIKLYDATCPVVRKLQQRVKKAYEENASAQIVIFGKPDHPEMIGLLGQTDNKAVVVSSDFSGFYNIDFSKKIILFSQTTQSLEGFHELVALIEKQIGQHKLNPLQMLVVNDTICRQVSRRGPALKLFAAGHDVVIFVSGAGSSNGRYLYGLCKDSNKNSFLISDPGQLQKKWFDGAKSVGISGATSTPRWQLQNMAKAIETMLG